MGKYDINEILTMLAYTLLKTSVGYAIWVFVIARIFNTPATSYLEFLSIYAFYKTLVVRK